MLFILSFYCKKNYCKNYCSTIIIYDKRPVYQFTVSSMQQFLLKIWKLLKCFQFFYIFFFDNFAFQKFTITLYNYPIALILATSPIPPYKRVGGGNYEMLYSNQASFLHQWIFIRKCQELKRTAFALNIYFNSQVLGCIVYYEIPPVVVT